MPRRLLLAALVLATSTGLAACTGAPTPTSSSAPQTTAPTEDAQAPAGSLPGCDEVTAALGGLVGDLKYNEALGDTRIVPEDYEQRACVYASEDEQVTLGVTISAIPFLQEELESYRTLPTVLVDDRAAAGGAVLQTMEVEGGPTDHLDSTMFLFDTVYSIAIQGYAEGGPTTDSIPQLTVAAATEAAFAVRALIA